MMATAPHSVNCITNPTAPVDNGSMLLIKTNESINKQDLEQELLSSMSRTTIDSQSPFRMSITSHSSQRTSTLSTSSSELVYDARETILHQTKSPFPASHVCENATLFKEPVHKRQQVAEEILETERRYVDCLIILNNIYYTPLLEACGTPHEIISKKNITEIFSNLKDIFGVNTELKKQLQDRIEGSPFNPNTTCIGDVFLMLTPYLKMYSLYVKNFNRAIALVSEIAQKNTLFSAFIAEQGLRPECKGRIFQTFLIEPVQRIPRYKLLLEDLLKRTSEFHPDYLRVVKALKLVSEVATFVNEEIRMHENVLQMIDIQKGLLGLNESLLAPGRHYIYRGHVIKISRKSHQARELILFSDVLIYASPSILEDQYIFHRKLPLDQFQVEDVPDTDVVKNAFQIVASEKSFAVYAETPELKREWIKKLTSTTAEWLASLESFRTAKSVKKQHIDYVAPVWVPDSLTDQCHICCEDFSLFNRKHHCRACGNIVCSSCSTKSFYIPQANRERLERCCDTCFEDIVRDAKFRVHIPHSLSINEPDNPPTFIQSTQKRTTLPRRSKVMDIDSKSSCGDTSSSQLGIKGTLLSTSMAASTATLWGALHPDLPSSCSLCRETYAYIRPMQLCTKCHRDICAQCLSRGTKTRCDPCSRGLEPDTVIINGQGGGWSFQPSADTL
ncbi:hypothetical protein BASA50_006778 [Batrachochytrium salamandrivorans]|uniref:Uncharacterized protein n=1 Tax=Batrachochytrium salamandrivorans TaxID=1357716 RepID=A0ABQ8F927_9FUNG|nr:hypothetical protein BASA60_002989 [Batrachochytrium salamandrivorans]KAH6594307.1 hypothetical protein BASA50_006778 [Batrachochytrium salamandrivorans]